MNKEKHLGIIREVKSLLTNIHPLFTGILYISQNIIFILRISLTGKIIKNNMEE